MSEAIIYQVALNVAINHTFSYLVKIEKDGRLDCNNLLGYAVLVSFGKKNKNNPLAKNQKIGLIVAKASEIEKKRIQEKKIELKSIEQIIGDAALLTEIEIDWLVELSNYYHQPIGEMIFQALPKGYKTYSSYLSLKKLHQNEANSKTNQTSNNFLHYWKLTEQLTEQSTDQGIEKKIVNQENKKLSAIQRDFLNEINLSFNDQPFNTIELRKIKNYSKPRFEKLLRMNWIESHQWDFSKPNDLRKITLTEEQEQIEKKIAKHSDQFGIDLIYGDTATGKTEIYIKIIHQVLKQNKQILYLVPEIGLVNQIRKRLKQATGLPTLAIHSNITPNQQHQIFNAIQSGKFALLVGTRSSAFFSFKNLGLIVIDEEHDSSYKQIENLHYSAKEALLFKAKKLNIPVLIGSATPSLEMIKLAKEKKIRLHRLIKKNQIEQRKIHLIDMSAEPKDRIFSLPLLKMIDQKLKADKQCLLFLNRRGYAPMLKCINCNWLMYCDDCDSAMVYHQFDQLMHCHHCNQKKPAKQNCPICSYKPLKLIGSGTEKLEQLLSEKFTQAKIWRIDRDKTEKKGQMTDLIESIESEKSGIIIGTQMLSKGHDFSNVSLVSIIDVDWYLLKPDIHSQQKLSQLLIQVMGRAGRKEIDCDVVLQTRNPENELIAELIAKGYDGFLDQAINQAEKYHLPPFAYQAACMASSKNRQKLYQFLALWREGLNQFNFDSAIEVWQIEPSPIEKKSNRYFAYFLLYSKNRTVIHQSLHLSVKEIIPKIKMQNQVRYYFDVNYSGVDI